MSRLNPLTCSVAEPPTAISAPNTSEMRYVRDEAFGSGPVR